VAEERVSLAGSGGWSMAMPSMFVIQRCSLMH
jgi:hypothetical protein